MAVIVRPGLGSTHARAGPGRGRPIVIGAFAALLFALGVLHAPPATAAGCGLIPIITDGTGPGWGGSELNIGNNVKVNNGTSVAYTSGTVTTHKVLPAAGGSPTTQAVALPALSPASFPSTSGSYSVAKNSSGALPSPPYKLNSLSVEDGGTLTLAPGDYFIGSINVGTNAVLRISPGGPVRMYTNTNASFDLGTSVNLAPDTGNAGNFVLFVYGNATVDIGKNVTWVGAVYAPASGSRINVRLNATIVGGLVTGGRLDITGETNFVYTPAVQSQLSSLSTCATPPPALHHLQLEHATGTGLTCNPSSLTLRACQDAACTTPYTGGVSATLSASGASVVWPGGTAATIPVGSSSASVAIHVTTVGSALFGALATAPTASGATSCNFGSPACTYTVADSGFVVSVPDHVAETTQAISISAVKKSDSSSACVPAFASVAKSVRFKCSAVNPATATLPVRVGGNALNAGNNAGAVCDATGQPVSLAFNASGVATTTLAYADVGAMALSASYTGSLATGDSGVLMTGGDGFIAAPASFAFSAISAAPIRAGVAFSATVTARNSAGATTPNFGRESPAEGLGLTFARRSPTGAGASNGSFSGSLGGFSSGSATSNNLVWSEVGTGDLIAMLQSGNYLGSGLTATGSTGAAGAVGRFIPHHFDVGVTPACSGSFTYAGQPFVVTVTARNGLPTPGVTLNYDGSAATAPNFARAVALSEATVLGVGNLVNATLAIGEFSAGIAMHSPSYVFIAKQTAPQTLALRATDTDGVGSNGYTEGSTVLRSGRLRLASAFGGIAQPLQMPALAEYWSGNAWLPNGADSCTTVPAAAVAISNPRNHQGNASAASTTASPIAVLGGQATLALAIPTPATGGVTFDIALNLGGTATDQSCHPNHPPTSGAVRGWLRSTSCGPADRDPAARASFGIYSPETRKTVHVRELY